MVVVLKHFLKRGMDFWAVALPLLAIVLYFLMVGANIGGSLTGNLKNLFGINGSLSLAELVILFILGPLFFTRMANASALIIAIYLCERAILGKVTIDTSCGLYVLIALNAIVAALGYVIPWNEKNIQLGFGDKLRKILFFGLAIVTLISCLISLVNLKKFAQWVDQTTSLGDSLSVAFLIIMGVITAWLLAVLTTGFNRRFLLLISIVPAMAILIFVGAWPSCILAAFFCLYLSIPLAHSRRRVF